MGESKLKRRRQDEDLQRSTGLQTVGGKIHVRWETGSAATPMEKLACFIEFLHLTGLWSCGQEACPLSHASGSAPSKADVLGTWMLSILSGHNRSAHIAAMRCDGVNPRLLGRTKVISETPCAERCPASPKRKAWPGWMPT